MINNTVNIETFRIEQLLCCMDDKIEANMVSSDVCVSFLSELFDMDKEAAENESEQLVFSWVERQPPHGVVVQFPRKDAN